MSLKDSAGGRTNGHSSYPPLAVTLPAPQAVETEVSQLRTLYRSHRGGMLRWVSSTRCQGTGLSGLHWDCLAHLHGNQGSHLPWAADFPVPHLSPTRAGQTSRPGRAKMGSPGQAVSRRHLQEGWGGVAHPPQQC